MKPPARRTPLLPASLLCLLLLGWLATLPYGLHARGEPPRPPRPAWWQNSLPPTLPNPVGSQAALAGSWGEPIVLPWSRLAYASYRTGNWELFLAASDGSGAQALAAHPAADTHPRLNRGGTELLFVSSRTGNAELYRVGVDGSGLRQLTEDPATDTEPTWSWDGTQLAFRSDRSGNPELYRMQSDGSGLEQLTADPAPDVMPTWSPDGQQLAWVRAVGPDRGQLMRLTLGDPTPHAVTPPLRYLQHPAWSPNGTRLAFDYDSTGDGWNEVGVIGVDGGGLQMLYRPGAFQDAWVGSWSPDGQRLAFSQLRYGFSQGEYFIEQATLGQLDAATGDPSLVSASTLDLLVDWQTLDAAPPIPRPSALPAAAPNEGLYVMWPATDVGGAGIGGYDVQVRDGPAGSWQPWLTDTRLPGSLYVGTPGAVVQVRSRARDAAFNVTPWVEHAGQTTLRRWQLGGQVTDARGHPVPRAALRVEPAPLDVQPATDILGHYQLRLLVDGPLQLQASHAGYRSPPPAPLVAYQDQAFPLVLEPATNLLMNGSFEEGGSGAPPGWRPDGTLPPAAVPQAHSGAWAQRLGASCPAPCLEATPYPFTGFPSVFAVDAAGTLHNVWVAHGVGDAPDTVQYAAKPAAGTWGPPEQVARHEHIGYEMDLAVGLDGSLHAVWLQGGQIGQIFYSAAAPGQPWQPPLALAEGESPALAVDPTGRVGLAYIGFPEREADQLLVRTHRPGQGWSQPLRLNELGYSISRITLESTPDGRMHVGWVEYGGAVLYRAEGAPDQWLPQTVVGTSGTRTALDGAGRLHVAWIDRPEPATSRLAYRVRSRAGTWSPTTYFAEPLINLSLGVDAGGTAHLISTSYYPGTDDAYIRYRSRTPAGAWGTPTDLAYGLYDDGLIVGSDGAVYILAASRAAGPPQPVLLERQRARVAGSAVLQQTVTIPTELHAPTLAFLFRPETLYRGVSRFHVTLSDAVTQTALFEAREGLGWQQGWADLAPWQGQPVTLTFALEQAAGEPLAGVTLDTVALGAWETPVLHRVLPGAIPQGWDGQVVTLQGANFNPGVTVRVGTQRLDAVVWVDAATLRVTLPATLPPGHHDVWVSAPAGQEQVLPGGLWLGGSLFLPLAMR